MRLRCMKTADTCICTGLNTYIIVITLDNAVNTVPRRIERNVKAGSPSSLADTRNLDTSNPAKNQCQLWDVKSFHI